MFRSCSSSLLFVAIFEAKTNCEFCVAVSQARICCNNALRFHNVTLLEIRPGEGIDSDKAGLMLRRRLVKSSS